jgi:voltage-gated potassium channel
MVSAADELWDKLSGNRRTAMNFLLVALCWLSLVPNLWLIIHTPHNEVLRHAILNADMGIAIGLGAAILWRWMRFRVGRRYLRKRLWEIPALFPFIVPVVGHWHVVLWFVLLCRLARVVDRTDSYFGDRIMVALIEHFTEPIVEAIKRPITIAVMDEVIDVIRVGTYAKNVRDALEENRGEIRSMVVDLVHQDPTASKLKYVPFHDDIVKIVTATVLRMVDGALVDPRTTEIIDDAIRNSAEQVRTAVHSGARAADFKPRD